jgi:hypothetical protein
VCMLAPTLHGQVSISVNLKNLGVANVTGSNAYARFTLKNYGSSLPSVIGSTVIVGDMQDFKPNGSGNISGVLQGNDTINPSGTFYQDCVFFQGTQLGCANYLITGDALNLNSVVPLTIIPNAGTNQVILQAFQCVVPVSSTTWTCTHNFSDSPVMVNPFDSTNKRIFPDATTVSNPNVATLTFVTPQAGTPLISHAGAVSLATSQPNAVLQNPSAGPVIQGPSTNTTFTGASVCKNSENIRCVDTANSVGWTGSDFGAWVNAAVANLPRYNSKPAGAIYVAQGTYAYSTPIVINSPYVYLIGASSVLNYTGNGAAVLFNDAPTSYDGDGGVRDIYMFGNGTANQVGFDLRGVTYQKWENVSVNNFNGTGGIGILFENVNGAMFWTENNDFENVRGLNNTVGIDWQDNCAHHSGCPSVSYTRFRHVVMSAGSGQTGFLLQHDMGLNGSDLEIQCFLTAGATCLHLMDTSAINLQRLKIGGEGTGAYNGILTDAGTTFSTTYMERWNAGTPIDSFNGTYIPYLYVNPGLGQLFANPNGLRIGNTTNVFDALIDTTPLTTFRTQKTPDASGSFLLDTATQTVTNKTVGDKVPFVETRAPAGVAGQDVCYGDSTAHGAKRSFNNDTFSLVTRFVDMGRVHDISGNQKKSPHVVIGTGTLSSGTPSTATIALTGASIFTSNTSYRCSVTNETTQANPLKYSNTSESTFVVTGPNTVTDSFSFVCIGN